MKLISILLFFVAKRNAGQFRKPLLVSWIWTTRLNLSNTLTWKSTFTLWFLWILKSRGIYPCNISLQYTRSYHAHWLSVVRHFNGFLFNNVFYCYQFCQYVTKWQLVYPIFWVVDVIADDLSSIKWLDFSPAFRFH